MLPPASSLVVSLCQLQSLAVRFQPRSSRETPGADRTCGTSQSGLSIEAADGGDWYMATNDFA